MDLFWPQSGWFRSLMPALLLVIAPLVIASILIASTSVTFSRFQWVSTILIKFSFSGIVGIVIGGLLLDQFMRWHKGRPTEPLGIALLWYAAAGLIPGLMVPAFGIFKQMILPLAGFPWDETLARWDRILFLGHDPWRVAHSVFGSLSAIQFFDFCYSKIWMVLMYGFPALVVALFRDTGMRMRLIGTWIVGWIIIASAAAWLFASAGPCYYQLFIGPDKGFAELNARLAALLAEAKAAGSTIDAIGFQPMLANGYKGALLWPAGGISAMPSMHLGMATLFAITGFCFHRWLGYILSAFWLTIWIGSFLLGWHYALDGLVAAPMMVLIWHIMGKLRFPFIQAKAKTG